MTSKFRFNQMKTTQITMIQLNQKHHHADPRGSTKAYHLRDMATQSILSTWIGIINIFQIQPTTNQTMQIMSMTSQSMSMTSQLCQKNIQRIDEVKHRIEMLFDIRDLGEINTVLEFKSTIQMAFTT